MATTELVHFDAAKRELALASSMDEVKLIRDKAEALRQYIKQQGAGLEMQNQCAEIKLRAERRAGEMLGEQERNKGAMGIGVPFHDVTAPTYDELGITRIQSHRWQAEARIPEERFEQHVAETKASGEELTSIGLYNLATQTAHVSHNSGNNEWYTPQIYIELARKVMGSIDCDPASSEVANEIIQASTYYTAEDDGRLMNWHGNVWLNPPYAQPLVSDFCGLLVKKYRDGEIRQACILVNNATETNFYQDMLKSCAAVCFIKGRVRFIDEDGTESGAPLQGQTVLYFGSNRDTFARCFGDLGVILNAE